MEKSESQDEEESRKNIHHKTTGLDKEEEGGSETTNQDSPSPSKIDMKKSSLAGTSSCSTSTVATVPMTPTTTTVATQNVTSTLVKRDDLVNASSSSLTDDVDRRRQSLMRQTLLLFLLSAVSFFIFLCLYLPTMALIAFGIFVTASCLAFASLYRQFLLEYDNMLRGRGIGDYLPASIYHQLAETTLHEWMSDSTFYLEYRHLLLYYVPGITTEQLEAMVNRLSPHHQEMLRRHGLGQFFGEGFMRLLMGDSRWQPQHQADQQMMLLESSQTNADDTAIVVSSRGLPFDGDQTEGETPPVRSITAAPLPRRLYDDDPSDIGSTEQGERAEDTVQDENTRDVEIEGQILTDAVYEMFQYYSISFLTSGAQSLNQLAVQAVDYLSPWVIRFGMGVTTLSAGVGLAGVWFGAYYPLRATTHLTPRFPSGRMLVSTALFGGFTAGTMLLIQRGFQTPKTEDAADNKDEKR